MKKIIITLFVLLNFSLIAQNVEFDKKTFPGTSDDLKIARKAFSKGDEYYELGPGNYTLALEQYMIAQKINPSNSTLNYRIGMTYMKGFQKALSLPYFETAYKLTPDVMPDIHFQLGQAYQLNFKFDQAIKEFNEALKIPLKEFTPDYINKRIKECETGKLLMAKPERVFIDNIGGNVNGNLNEYAPVISADESVLMYTSRRPTTTGEGSDPRDLTWYEDIYISQNINDTWQPSTNPGKPLNSDNHDATVGLSNDGQILFIYKGDEGGGDIFQCKLEGDSWLKPEKLNRNVNSNFHEPAASLSPDGKTIYFCSSREGGYGNHDLYYCQLEKNGKWGSAVNLGPEINTPFEEEAIFIHPDGKTIYFSSQGHSTMGGFDIFKSTFENGKWTTPVNLGYPINTPDDEIGFVLSASGRHGYYSSVREGGFGGLDIYMITILGPEKQPVNNSEDNLIASATAPVSETIIASQAEVKVGQPTILKGVISEAFSKLPLGAKIELVDNKLNEVIATFESNAKSGKYLVSLPAGRNYGITVKKDGYLFHSENFDIPESSGYQEIVKNIDLNKVAVGSRIVLRNIFFDFDKATLRSESTMELDNLANLLKEYSTLKIEISGHTDNKGSDQYNTTLSLNRAKAVVDYLVEKKGIDRARLESKGYGKTLPVASNDTDEGRQLNRRTEFKILSK